MSQFTSQRRWTYAEFDQALSDGEADCQLVQLVAEHLYRLRGAEQALVARRWEGVGYLDEDGKLIQKPFQSQMIVAEFAIAANRFVAEYAQRQQIGLLFRNQNAAVEQLRSPLLQQLLAIDDPQTLRRYLSQKLNVAEYSASCSGHFSLVLEAYCHFTSPIRRYVDLVNHRMIKASLLGQPMPYSMDELEAQAATVNSWREAAREKTHQYFKAAAKAEQEQRLAQPQNLELLSAKAFSKLVVTACETGKLAAIADELHRRATNNQLSLVDIRWILLRGTLPDLQAQILSQLSATDAVSVLAMEQEDGVIEAVDWEFESDDRGWWARATGQVKGEAMATPWTEGSKKQIAKANAAKAMLAGWLEQSLIPLAQAKPFEPVFVDLEGSAMDDASSAVGSADEETEINYIGELNTLAQRQGTLLPDYEIVANDLGGFQATVTWEGDRCEALGRSKKQAKAAAARQLWNLLNS